MTAGRLESIHLASAAKAPMVCVQEVEALAGVGLVGDRYAAKAGRASAKPGHQITLIEAETIEALALELNLKLEPGETRRNLITRGIALNHLVGRDFTVGEVRLHGHELCEPCSYLVRLTGKPLILPGLVHRGGLRAEILIGGVLRAGDPIGC